MNRIAKTSLIVLTISAVIFSCKKAEVNENSEVSEVQLSNTETISSSAAVAKEDSTHKFIHTADLKFKVKNVPQSTYYIENIVSKFDGFVSFQISKAILLNKIKLKLVKTVH